MKKLFSIPLAMLILLTGMHFSIAKHICRGEVTDITWSFMGEEAGCGMDNNAQDCSIHDTFTSGCCDNDVDVFSIDSDYNTSFFSFNEHSKAIEINLNSYSESTYRSNSAEIQVKSNSPPDFPDPSAVSLADICIFRI